MAAAGVTWKNDVYKFALAAKHHSRCTCHSPGVVTEWDEMHGEKKTLPIVASDMHHLGDLGAMGVEWSFGRIVIKIWCKC